MTKYEIKTDRFEFSNSKKSWPSQTADDIIDLYFGPYECLSPKLEASFDSLEEAKSEFESHYRNYGSTREVVGWAGMHLLVGEIAFLEENEYDEDGEFDQGGDWIAWSVEPYTSSEDKKKTEIAETAINLMELLDECQDLDFVDDVVNAVKYNETSYIANYLS